MKIWAWKRWCSLQCTSLALPEISQILVSTPITTNACQRYLAPGQWEPQHQLSWVHVWQEGWNSTIPPIHFLVVAVVADSVLYKEAFQKERKALPSNPLKVKTFCLSINLMPVAAPSTSDTYLVTCIHPQPYCSIYLVFAPCGNSSRKIIKWIYIFIQKK